MCGITGYLWNSHSPAIAPSDFDRMTDLLTHRGPNGRGVHRIEHADGSGVSLGHRRLSIIDVGGGAQPMSNEDGTIWVTFNGEIYNYRELRPMLESAGHQFRSDSDTETIVHLYEQFGDDFVDHLRGMFAIAIWDDRRRRLVMARDRMGQKPLVYYHDSNRLVFASELKAILAAPNVPNCVRPAAIDEYLLYGYIPHPGTIYENIHKLPPAHLAVLEQGKLTLRRYWNPDLSPDPMMTETQMHAELNEVIDEATRLQLRSDVPLGAFLSGGIDSTIIVGLMQRHAQRATKTYTIGFPEAGFDESIYAKTAAEHLGTEHHHLQVHPRSPQELIEKLVWLFDEPFADSSAIPCYYLSQLTRQHVTVALTGDGGDELFAGYERYRTVNQLGAFDGLPGVLRRALTGPWADWIPNGPQSSIRQRLKHRLQILRMPPEKRYVSWLTENPTSTRHSLYNKDFRKEIVSDQADTFLQELMSENIKLNPGVGAMRTDMQSYLPCDLLAKVDMTSMAHGLECRSPFLDHRVVETACKIPYRLLSQRGRVKPCLTSTFSKLIPESLQRRPKMGFSVPLDRWFRRELKHVARDRLLASDAFCHRYLSVAALKGILDEHDSGRRDNGDRIWSLLFLEEWGRQSVSSPSHNGCSTSREILKSS